MSEPRILFIRNSRGITDISGAETYLVHLMRGVIADGCQAELLCAIDSRTPRPTWLDLLDVADLPYQTVDVTSKISLADLRAAHNHARALGSNVIHALDHRSDAIAAWLNRQMGIPAVASFFGWTNFSETSWRGRLYPRIDRLLMRQMNRIIVDSEFIGRRTDLPASMISVIPNGVDLERFDPDHVVGGLKSRWFGTEDITLVGLIGRMHPNKGHLDLARAAARLCPHHPELRFVTIGATPPGQEDYACELRALLAAEGLLDRFLVTNVNSCDIPSALASFDITALPSYMESLSYVMLESMAMNTPVISARVGGHGDLIKDGENGLLFESGDVAALAKGIDGLAIDSALRFRIANSARAAVVEHYSTGAMIARTRAVYEEIRSP
jgi:glycosyltransferase involved in cell wall biosynthesis